MDMLTVCIEKGTVYGHVNSLYRGNVREFTSICWQSALQKARRNAEKLTVCIEGTQETLQTICWQSALQKDSEVVEKS